MLVFDEKYLRESIDMKDMLAAIEDAYHMQSEGNYSMPDRLSYVQEKGTFVIMPCFSDKYYSVKMVGTYPDNKLLGKPSIYGTMTLFDAKTGEVLALIDASYLTGIRTGAVGGLSSKYLAKAGCTQLAVLGAGMQGVFQTWAAATVRPITDVYVYDAFESALCSFAERLHQYRPGLRVHPVKDAAEAAAAGEMIITCTTSPVPILPDDPSLFKGKHITAIGSFEPTKRELPPAVLKTAEAVFVDAEFAIKESGDLAIPIKEGWAKAGDIKEFRHIVNHDIDSGRLMPRTTLFKSVGIGLFDLCAAKKIYESADSK